MAFNPFFPKHAIDPESVETSLLDDDEREDLPRPRPRFAQRPLVAEIIEDKFCSVWHRSDAVAL